ncbi:MAG: helix-turn-helix transcriptional regulator [Coxiellaceae bacterium]|nr:helix-turn-helix transcriptional regulator [Coxiellaceae bacterium]
MMIYKIRSTKRTKLQENLQRLIVEESIKSGSDLARQLKIPPPSINRILSGQVTDPRISTLILLADYFDVSIDQLLGREEL